jgi:hypothetical protein
LATNPAASDAVTAMPRRPSRRTLVLSGVALAVVAAGVVLAIVLAGGDDEGGPVRSTDRNALSFTRRAGTTFTYGLPVVVNTAADVAVLRRATLASPTPGLTTPAVRVGGPRRSFAGISGDDHWPPAQAPRLDLRRLAGFRLAPVDRPDGKMGAALLFALRAARPGRYTMRGVKLEYSVGDHTYTQLVPTALAVCVAPARGRLPRGCPLPPITHDGKVVRPPTVTFDAAHPEGTQP